MRCNLFLLFFLITNTLRASPIGSVPDFFVCKKTKATIELSQVGFLKIDQAHLEVISIQSDGLGVGIKAESRFVYSQIDIIERLEKVNPREVQCKDFKPIRCLKSIAFTTFLCPYRFLNPTVLSKREISELGGVWIKNNLIYSVKPSYGSIAVSKSHYYKYFKLANDES